VTSDPRPSDPLGSAAPDPFRPAGPDDQTTAVPAAGSSAQIGWARPEAATVPAGAPAVGPGGSGPVPGSAPASAAPFDRPGALPATSPIGPATVRSRSGGSGMLVNVLLGIAVVIAVGGVAFAVGRATAPTTAAAATNGRFGNGGFAGPNASGAPGGGFVGPGGFGGVNGGLSIEGTVTAISADSITVKLASGQTVTIPIDAQTTYHQRASATAADVTSGSTVIVQLQGGRGAFTNGNGNGGPTASGQPTRTLPAATSITLAPTGS
jgi:hypothetical protein